ncbi:lactate/malate family dehydrogenase [Celerinatantimonas sp. YJH-8]|uniref:lactate/malate family dehydrogenase n=1 Tax=Celerinatantimonas sp. YJH-8 TaxID=3228714 RepID=UPI0038C57C1F
MSRHVAIIGCGHVGADVACSLVTQNYADHISLFDKKSKKAASEALELQDMASLVGSRVVIDANDKQQLAHIDLVVMAVGPKKTQTVDRLNELAETSQAAGMWVPKLRDAGFKGVLINITNPCDVVTTHLAELLNLPTGHVFGTGTSLDSARMRRVVGQQLNVDPASVEGYTMGEHGESQFVAWSSVRVGGVPFTQWPQAEGVDLSELEMRVRRGGWDILEGKGWTSFGIAAAAAKLVDAVFSDARRVFPVSALHESLGVFIGQPALIGAQGVIQTIPVPLTEDEQQRLAASAQVIRHAKASILS